MKISTITMITTGVLILVLSNNSILFENDSFGTIFSKTCVEMFGLAYIISPLVIFILKRRKNNKEK